MKPNPRLEIFDGEAAPDAFMDDLEMFLKLENSVKGEIIRRTFSLYPRRGVDKEWNKWMKAKTKKEKDQLTESIKVVLFIMQQGLLKRFTDEYFTQELKTMSFDPGLISLFLSEFNRNKETLLQEIEKSESPIIERLYDLDWRIDIKKSSRYARIINEPCIILKIFLSKEKSDKIVFELSSGELKSLIRTLSLVQNEVTRLETKRGKNEE